MKTLTASTSVDVQLIKENKFNKKGNIFGWCIVETKPTKNAPKPLKVKLLFVRCRNNSNKSLCLLCMDLSLSNEDIIVTHAKRCKIEVMFKNQKQHLRLVSTSCSRNIVQSLPMLLKYVSVTL